MMKTVEVPRNVLACRGVKAARAADLTRGETGDLMAWCDCQRGSLWVGMTLQEILNVYRASASFGTFESMEKEDPAAAVAAWNRVIINRCNRIVKANRRTFAEANRQAA